MIFKKQKFVFQMRKSIMVAEKYKRNYCWHFWISINRKPIYIIKALNFINSFWPYGRLLENPKTLGLGELFLPKNDLKTCSAVNSTKWLKKWILWFSEFPFNLKYISNKDDIWQGKTLPGMILEERVV